MRASDFSPDRRKRLVPVPGRENVKALVPPRCPRTLDALPVLDVLVAAERAIASTAAVARLLPRPDLITRSLERREAVLSSQIEGTRTDLTQLLEYEPRGPARDCPTMPGSRWATSTRWTTACAWSDATVAGGTSRWI